MSVTQITSDEKSVTFQVVFSFGDSMLRSEDGIQDKLNEVGKLSKLCRFAESSTFKKLISTSVTLKS